MRKDMKKVLCERPRSVSSDCYHEVRRRENRGDPEDLPSFQGIAVPYRQIYDGGKNFTDHISPLIRYLWGCIGRRYDDVWSEICATAPSGNTVDDHLKGHVQSVIEVNTFIKDGEVWSYGRLWPSPVHGLYVDADGVLQGVIKKKRSRDLEQGYDGFWYIKGEDGVLWPKRAWRAQSIPTLAPVKPISETEEARLIDGVWYKFRVEIVPPVVRMAYVVDGETKYRNVSQYRYDVLYGTQIESGKRVRTDKRQLSSRELRKYNLKNQ